MPVTLDNLVTGWQDAVKYGPLERGDLLNRSDIDYDTSDGTCIRDYVHFCDLVDAHVLGLQWLQSGRGSRVFNLVTWDGFSVRQVID